MSTPQEWLEQTCLCHECGGEMEVIVGELTYEMDDMTVVVENVPMRRCRACGRRTVPGMPAMAIDEIVQEYVRAEREHKVVDKVTLHYREGAEYRHYTYAD